MDMFTETEQYIAPELYKRPCCYADEADIWSLGLVAMQLSTPWSPASDDEWDANDFVPWMRNVILANIAESPRQFHVCYMACFVRSRHQGGVPGSA